MAGAGLWRRWRRVPLSRAGLSDQDQSRKEQQAEHYTLKVLLRDADVDPRADPCADQRRRQAERGNRATSAVI